MPLVPSLFIISEFTRNTFFAYGKVSRMELGVDSQSTDISGLLREVNIRFIMLFIVKVNKSHVMQNKYMIFHIFTCRLE